MLSDFFFISNVFTILCIHLLSFSTSAITLAWARLCRHSEGIIDAMSKDWS